MTMSQRGSGTGGRTKVGLVLVLAALGGCKGTESASGSDGGLPPVFTGSGGSGTNLGRPDFDSGLPQGIGGVTGAGGRGAGAGGMAMGGISGAGGAGGMAQGGSMAAPSASGGSSGRGGTMIDAALTPPSGPDAANAPDAATIDATTFFVPRTTTDPVIAAPAAVAQTCATVAATICDRTRECRAGVPSTLFADDADCRLFYERDCRLMMTAPLSGDTSDARLACVAAMKSQTCTEFLAARPDACTPPRGTAQVAQPCRSTDQCTDGSFCEVPLAPPGQPNFSTGYRCGKCAKRAELGQLCSLNSNRACVAGADCYSLGGPGQTQGMCLRRKVAGDACTFLDFCDGSRCVQNICVVIPRAALGESCAGSTLCEWGKDLFCNRMTLSCEKLPPPATLGQYCGGIQDGSGRFISCQGGLSCSGVALMGFARVCEPRANVSQGCNNVSGPFCGPSLTCFNNLCLYLEPAVCQ